MDREMQRRHLAQAERHIAQGERHIGEQRLRIARLRSAGADCTLAEDLLHALLTSQALHVMHRQRICAELAK
jgi:hypothetical protein